jgi:hypothetical protein
MIREGEALAFVRYSTAYVKEKNKTHMQRSRIMARRVPRAIAVAPSRQRTTILGPAICRTNEG